MKIKQFKMFIVFPIHEINVGSFYITTRVWGEVGRVSFSTGVRVHAADTPSQIRDFSSESLVTRIFTKFGIKLANIYLNSDILNLDILSYLRRLK